jgi:glycosyltransferase involved in cell wall biosynthesis
LPAEKRLTFITAEYGLGAENFPDPIPSISSFVSGADEIVTPSSWSKMRLSDYGFPSDKIQVVPHGVNPAVFFPQTLEQRNATRKAIGLTSDDFVFLNLGAMSINKGIDVLLLAHHEVRKKFPQAKLLLKDDRNLYRLSGVDVIGRVTKEHPHLATDEFLSSIKLLSVTLPVHEMCKLYCLADVYASPYRAEGFNLPVIESIASGTPVIVTAGGATDDFCNALTALRIPSTRGDPARFGLPAESHLLEPDLDGLIDAMTQSIDTPRKPLQSFEAGRVDLVNKFSWSAAVRQLATHF